METSKPAKKRSYPSGAQKQKLKKLKERNECVNKNMSIGNFFSTSASGSKSTIPDEPEKELERSTDEQGELEILENEATERQMETPADIVRPEEQAEHNQTVVGTAVEHSDSDKVTETCLTDSKLNGQSYKSVEFKENVRELFPSDKCLYENTTSIGEELLLDLVTHGACQPMESDLKDQPYYNTNGRKFSSTYYFVQNTLGEKRCRHWLAYSYRKGYAYCHMCWLFGSQQARASPFVSPGITDMKHLSERIKTHADSKLHRESREAFNIFRNSADIKSSLDQQISAEAAKWREVLTVQFSLIRTMAALNLPFRGDSRDVSDPNCGVYLSLLKEIAKYNPTLKTHLQSEAKIKYLSETITNEQIEILSSMTLNKILDDINNAKFWTIIADSTTDIRHQDQMAIMVRYVSVDYDQNKIKVCETFLTFVEIKDASAHGITEKIIQKVQDLGLNLKYLRGQSFDGASVMSGHAGGVQALLRSAVESTAISEKWEQPVFLPYVHCPPHQLALIILHAAQSRAPARIINFFGIVEQIYVFMASSNRRWNRLLDKSKSNTLANQSLKDLEKMTSTEDEEGGETKTNRLITLKALCATRWAARHKSTEAIRRNFGAIIDCLADIIEERHDPGEVSQATALQSNLTYEFLVTLIFWDTVLLKANLLTTYLQSKENDLFLIVSMFNDLIRELEEMRSDEKFEHFVEMAKYLWCSLEPICRVQRHAHSDKLGELSMDEKLTDAKQSYKCEAYFVCLDSMMQELKLRTKGMEEVANIFGFIQPSNFKLLTDDEIDAAVEKMITLFPNEFTAGLSAELKNFKSIFFKYSIRNQAGVLPYLLFISENRLADGFPEIEILIRLFLTLPIGIASAERSFSVLRRLKTYLRSSMSDRRLSNLALLCIEREKAAELDLNSTIKLFADKKARRGVTLSL